MTFDGTTLIFTFDWEEGKYGSTTPVFTLTVDGNEMSGSGDWISARELMHEEFDLKHEWFSLLSTATITYIAAFEAIATAIAAIVIILANLKVPTTPRITHMPHYGQGYERSIKRTIELSSPPLLPEGGTSVRGIGMSFESPVQPTMRPLPPREYFMSVSSDPPDAPITMTRRSSHITPGQMRLMTISGTARNAKVIPGEEAERMQS